MIALRGIVRQNEERKWTWGGVWTFGDLPENQEEALQAKNPSVRPFMYTWEESRKAADVLVPSSANVVNSSTEKGEVKKNEPLKDGDSEKEKDTAKALDATTNETTEAKQLTPAEASNESSGSKDVEMTDAGATGGDEKEPPEATTKSDDAKPMEVETSEESKADTGKEKGKSVEKPDEESKADSSKNQDVSSKPSVAFQEQTKPAAKKEGITFATTLPEDPPFTDADTKHPDKCPPGGAWKGYFETATVSACLVLPYCFHPSRL